MLDHLTDLAVDDREHQVGSVTTIGWMLPAELQYGAILRPGNERCTAGDPLMLVDLLGVGEGRTGLIRTLSTRAATEKPAAGRSLPQHVIGHHGDEWI